MAPECSAATSRALPIEQNRDGDSRLLQRTNRGRSTNRNRSDRLSHGSRLHHWFECGGRRCNRAADRWDDRVGVDGRAAQIVLLGWSPNRLGRSIAGDDQSDDGGESDTSNHRYFLHAAGVGVSLAIMTRTTRPCIPARTSFSTIKWRLEERWLRAARDVVTAIGAL